MLSSRGKMSPQVPLKKQFTTTSPALQRAADRRTWHQQRSRVVRPTSIAEDHGRAKRPGLSPLLARALVPASSLLSSALSVLTQFKFLDFEITFHFFCSPIRQFLPLLPFQTNSLEAPAAALPAGSQTHAEPLGVCSQQTQCL